MFAKLAAVFHELKFFFSFYAFFDCVVISTFFMPKHYINCSIFCHICILIREEEKIIREADAIATFRQNNL